MELGRLSMWHTVLGAKMPKQGVLEAADCRSRYIMEMRKRRKLVVGRPNNCSERAELFYSNGFEPDEMFALASSHSGVCMRPLVLRHDEQQKSRPVGLR